MAGSILFRNPLTAEIGFAIPPHMINKGNIQGTLNNKYVTTMAISMITCVMVFFTEILKALTAANNKKPMAIGCIYLE